MQNIKYIKCNCCGMPIAVKNNAGHGYCGYCDGKTIITESIQIHDDWRKI